MENQKNIIPYFSENWYDLNNSGDGKSPRNGIQQLNDGITNESMNVGHGKVIELDRFVYSFRDHAKAVNITSVELYSFQGGDPNAPWNLYAKAEIDSELVLLASFVGNQYMTNQIFKVNNVPAKYLVVESKNHVVPTEMILCGSFKPVAAPTLYPKKDIAFKETTGVNGYEWYFEDANTSEIVESRFNALKIFGGVRHYLDWDKIEHTQGVFTFAPTRMGGWNYDRMYERLKAANIDILPCLKELPEWVLNTWPEAERNNENVPVLYGANYTDPASYIPQAKAGFQLVARYGSVAVPLNLLPVDQKPRWPNDTNNTPRSGLNLIKYIECDNERDKWWKGRKAYQNGYEYAANLSAFYDGHKGAFGKTVGVKTADPSIQVVAAGTAGVSADYFKAIIDWSLEYRGLKADGTIDIPFDVINIHCYNTDNNIGLAPELSGLEAMFAPIVKLGLQYNKEVWVTETGYDEIKGSRIYAPPIGTKSAELVKADWTLRTSLIYARLGINRVYYYQAYDDAPGSDTVYATSGLLQENKPNGRRPAADYLYQAKKLIGDYVYKSTNTANGVLTDTYSDGKNTILVLLSPTNTGATTEYFLDLNQYPTAQIKTPAAGQSEMAVINGQVLNKVLKLSVTETPIFIILNTSTTPNEPDAPVDNSKDALIANQASTIKTLESQVNQLNKTVVDLQAAITKLTYTPPVAEVPIDIKIVANKATGKQVLTYKIIGPKGFVEDKNKRLVHWFDGSTIRAELNNKLTVPIIAEGSVKITVFDKTTEKYFTTASNQNFKN